MRNKFRNAFAMFLLCFLFATTSYSATVDTITTTDAGKAIVSLTGLSWTSGLYNTTYGPYDVYFDGGSYNNVVADESDVTFNLNEAYEAGAALAEVINDYNLSAATNIVSLDDGEAEVPYYPTFALIPGEVIGGVIFYRTLLYDSTMLNPEWYVDAAANTVASDGPGVWAVYHTAVPIPGAVWLLGSGLIGLVGIRRKIKN